MSKSPNRFWLAIAFCGALGIIFGCATSEAAINQCTQTDDPSNTCLTRDPWVTRIENIGMGLFAGVGAAVGATWQSSQRND